MASAYRSLVDDLTRGARGRAARAAQTVLSTAGLEGWANDTSEKVAQLADEVGQASRANRDMFEQLVATEVGRAATRVGLVPKQELRDTLERMGALSDEVDALRSEVDELKLRLAVLEAVQDSDAQDPVPA